jgi:pSer/pThr/pTyr-binding forkhead associated (FHA) protein
VVNGLGRPGVDDMVYVRAWHIDRPEDVQEQELTAGHLTIGRGLDNDLQLDVAGASRHHARVEREHDEVWLVDLGSTNGTWAGGQRVDRTRLSPGDRFQIGAVVFEVATASLSRPTLVEDWGPIQLERAPRVSGLRVRSERPGVVAAAVTVVDPTSGRPLRPAREIPARGLSLGRDPTNDLCLEDSEVSRFHARIEVRDEQFTLQDLGSRNGTWVQRVRVRQHLLHDGDLFTMGIFTLRFSGASPALAEVSSPGASPEERTASLPVLHCDPGPDAGLTSADRPPSGRCGACGAELAPGDKFCGGCGRPNSGGTP